MQHPTTAPGKMRGMYTGETTLVNSNKNYAGSPVQTRTGTKVDLINGEVGSLEI